MLELADEEPGADQLLDENERPEDSYVPPWGEVYWRGWHHLRFDRQYLAFGGETPITFAAIDAYARRYGIKNVEFENFLTVVGEMDVEYREHLERVREAEEEAEATRRRLAGAP